MQAETKTADIDMRKFFLVCVLVIISGIWGVLLPGTLSLKSSINLGNITITPQIALMIGVIFSVIALLIGMSKEWYIQIGTYFTIQSKHILITGSVLFLLTSFTFNGFDFFGFFIYYYEIIIISLYSAISDIGLTDIAGYMTNISYWPLLEPFNMNIPSVILGIIGIFLLVFGLFMARLRSDFKLGRITVQQKTTGTLLFGGVVSLILAFFVNSLYQPGYVTEHGVVANDGILKTILGLPLSTLLIEAISEFYLSLAIYLYPLAIFSFSVYLIRMSTEKSSQPEPFINKKLSLAFEEIPKLVKRAAKLFFFLMILVTVIVFLLIMIQWIVNVDLFYDLQIFLFKNVTGILGLSLLILVLAYLPKIVKPFLEGRIVMYTARRVITIIPIFIGISIICFGLMQASGSPINTIMSRLSPGPGRDIIYQDLLRVYGLNAPAQSQWFNWFIHFCMGDMGNSIISGEFVIESIAVRIGPTLEISVIPLIITLGIAIPLGIYAALRQYTWKDNVISISVAIGLSIPIFLLILLCILLFGYYIPILPPGEMSISETNMPNINLLYASIFRNSFIQDLISWQIWDLFFHLIIPVGAIVIIGLALYVRLVRSGYLEVIRQDYILSAQAYGFDERTIIFRHSLKNVMIPIVTFIGLSIGGLLGGAPITETTLSWPGLGYYGVTSIRSYDYPVVMGLIMVTAILILLANLFADLLYSIIDPRVSL